MLGVLYGHTPPHGALISHRFAFPGYHRIDFCVTVGSYYRTHI